MHRRAQLAQMLLERGGSGDLDKAGQLIEQAIAAAGELGMQPLIVAALAVKAEAGLS